MNRLPLVAMLLVVLGGTAAAQGGANPPKQISLEDVRRAVLSQTFKGIQLTGEQYRQADSILFDHQQNVHALERGASDCHEKLVKLYAQRDSGWVRVLSRETDKAKLIKVLKNQRPSRLC